MRDKVIETMNVLHQISDNIQNAFNQGVVSGFSKEFATQETICAKFTHKSFYVFLL